MTGKDRIILQKIIGYASDAIEYISGISFEGFMSDKKTVSASAFAIGQIGELARRLSENSGEKTCES